MGCIKKRKKTAITLAELMISISLMTLIVFGIFMTLSMLMRAGQKNIDTSSGYVAASSIMKDFILHHEYRTTSGINDSIIYGNKKYNYEIAVRQPISGLRAYQITITVRWKDSADHYGKGGNLEATVSTIVEDDNFGNTSGS